MASLYTKTKRFVDNAFIKTTGKKINKTRIIAKKLYAHK